MRQLINGFTSGELSPWLMGRVDLSSLRNGCRILKNFLPRTLGGVTRRPGTVFLGSAKTQEGTTRLIPFSFNTSSVFMLELGNRSLRIWKNLALVQAYAGGAIEIETPWTSSELDQVQFCQVNNLIFFVHPNHPIQELRRKEDQEWVLREFPLIWPAMRDLNATPATMKVLAGAGVPVPGPGAGKLYAWYFSSLNTRQEMTDYMSANAGLLTLPGAPPPMQASGVWAINPTWNIPMVTWGGVQYTTEGQRLEGFFKAPSTGNYKFRMLDHVSVFSRMNFQGSTILNTEAVTPAVNHESAVYALNANSTHSIMIETILGSAYKSSGKTARWQFRIGTGAWQNLTAAHFVEATPSTGPGGQPVTGQAGRVICSVPEFEPSDAGGYYQVSHRRAATQSELALTAAGTSPVLRVLGEWEVFSTGLWNSEIFLEEETADLRWDIVRSWKGKDDHNIQASGRVDKEKKMRLRVAYTSNAGTVPPRAVLTATDPLSYGLVKITNVIDSKNADCLVVRGVENDTDTVLWSQGAWSPRNGYPRAVCLHKGRMILGGTKRDPQTIWGSGINSWDNYLLSRFEDDGFAFLMAAQETNPIVWMVSQAGVIVGTEGDEWLIADVGQLPDIQRKTRYGSAAIQAQLVGSVAMFVQRGGEALREYVFAFEESNYKAPEISQLSEHLFRSGIKRFAFAQRPEPMLWVLTNDGVLLSCTYRRESEVIAWARHETAGIVEDLAVMPGANSDELWLAVCRNIAGNEVRFIEALDPDHWLKMRTPQARRSELVFFDAAVSLPVTNHIVGGLEHLEGATVAVKVDGKPHVSRVVTAGRIELEFDGVLAVVGIPFESRMAPFLFDTPLQDGTAQGLKTRTPEIRVRFYESGTCESAETEDGPFHEVPFRRPIHNLGEVPPLFSGLTDPIFHQAHFRDSVEFCIQTSSGEPLNILSVVTQSGINGR